MGCCGRGRAKIAAQSTPRTRPSSSGVSPPSPAHRFTIRFEYTGSTAMTVHGPVSGRRYRFPARGAAVTVDPRDRSSLARVPNLRECR
jgi:hypothetical protein